MVSRWAGPGGRRFSGTRPNAPGRKPPAAAAGAAAGAGHGPRAGRLGHRRAASAAQGERADRQSALRRRPRHARAARRLDRRPDAGSRAAAGEGGIGRPRRAPEGFPGGPREEPGSRGSAAGGASEPGAAAESCRDGRPGGAVDPGAEEGFRRHRGLAEPAACPPRDAEPFGPGGPAQRPRAVQAARRFAGRGQPRNRPSER